VNFYIETYFLANFGETFMILLLAVRFTAGLIFKLLGVISYSEWWYCSSSMNHRNIIKSLSQCNILFKIWSFCNDDLWKVCLKNFPIIKDLLFNGPWCDLTLDIFVQHNFKCLILVNESWNCIHKSRKKYTLNNWLNWTFLF
jgi:hypothetical protein